MRVFLKTLNERVANKIVRFLQLDDGRLLPREIAQGSQLYLSTTNDNRSSLRYGIIINVNHKGLTMELKDSKTNYLSFVPWEAVHEFKISMAEPLYLKPKEKVK
jgi:hypothetical protein